MKFTSDESPLYHGSIEYKYYYLIYGREEIRTLIQLIVEFRGLNLHCIIWILKFMRVFYFTDARRFELLVLKRTPRLKPGTLNHSVTHPLKLDWCNMYNMYNYRHGTRTHNGRNQCFYRAPPLPVRNICIIYVIPRPWLEHGS